MNFLDFGHNLKTERIKKNISAYELSLRIDKNVSYVGQVERGKINISLKSILAICDTLKIPITELLKEEEKNSE